MFCHGLAKAFMQGLNKVCPNAFHIGDWPLKLKIRVGNLGFMGVLVSKEKMKLTYRCMGNCVFFRWHVRIFRHIAQKYCSTPTKTANYTVLYTNGVERAKVRRSHFATKRHLVV